MGIPTKRPRMDHSGLDQPEFGINQRNPQAVVGENEPVALETGIQTLNFSIYPVGDMTRLSRWDNRTPIFSIGTIHTDRAMLALDLATFQAMCHNTADVIANQEANNNRAMDKTAIEEFFARDTRDGTGVGHLEMQSGKRLNDLNHEAFWDMDVLRDRVHFMGVLMSGVEPLYQRSNYRSDYSTPQINTPMNAAVEISGMCQFPDLFDCPEYMSPLGAFYIIIKKVPIRDTGNHYDPFSWVVNNGIDQNMKRSARQLTVDLIFYYSPDGTPPERESSLYNCESDPEQQPPLYSRSYKEFPNPKKPNQYTIEDGIVIYLGYPHFQTKPLTPASSSMHYSRSRHQRARRLSSFKPEDVLSARPIQMQLCPRMIY